MSGATCNSCGRLIRWELTEAKGRRIPLDYEPAVNGNIDLRKDGHGRDVAVVVAAGSGTYVSHFATCPNAAKHRKKDRKAA